VEKGLVSKGLPGREKTGTHPLKPWKKEVAFFLAFTIWIPVFFALFG